MDTNEVSRPETVMRLRNTRQRLHLTVTQVWNMIQQADINISEATVRRFFNDDTPPETNFRNETIEAISEILYGSKADDFDPTKCRLYYEEARELRSSMREYERSMAENEARLGFYRELLAEQRRENDFLKDTIKFLEGRLEYISPEKRKCGCDQCSLIDNERQKKG